eukprot:13334007-Heterocapsa_arctica.AAC.1
MEQEDICHPYKGTANKVYIDGSSYEIGASISPGWGIWSPDEESCNEHGPLKGKMQSSDRAEVRALVAALEKAENNIEVITDNQYVRGTAQYIAAGGMLGHIRWAKAHLKQDKATAAGVSYEDWFGNNKADIQAKKGAEKHGDTNVQKNLVLEKVDLTKRVQHYMITN